MVREVVTLLVLSKGQIHHSSGLDPRKVALRRGEELETQQGYVLKPSPLKKVLNNTLGLDELTEMDFKLEITQKGVDMRIGLDIASLAERQTVNQIVMITGDSDFVPAAKHARREGIDFILDPMWAPIAKSLSEHVDGIRQCVFKNLRMKKIRCMLIISQTRLCIIPAPRMMKSFKGPLPPQPC